MTHSYEKYISRLRSLREQRPELKAYQRNIETETPLLTRIGREATANMQRSGASVASQAAVLQQQQGDIANIHRTAYNDALAAGEQRNATIDSKIADVGFAQDQALEQEQQQKDARKAGLLKVGMQVGGAALGAGIGAFAGNPLLGAKIGSAGGQMLSSFVGNDSKIATDNFNAEEFNQGLQDTISGISGALTLKSQKTDMLGLSEQIAGIDSLQGKDIAMVSGYIQAGMIQEATEYIKMVRANTAAATPTSSPMAVSPGGNDMSPEELGSVKSFVAKTPEETFPQLKEIGKIREVSRLATPEEQSAGKSNIYPKLKPGEKLDKEWWRSLEPHEKRLVLEVQKNYPNEPLTWAVEWIESERESRRGGK